MDAAANLKTLSTFLDAALSVEADAQSEMDAMEKTLAQIVAMKVDHEQKKVEHLAEQKRRREEAERKRKEAEHKALIERELAMADTAKADSTSLIEQRSYQEALDILNEQFPTYQTDEGKAAVQFLIDRYTHLARLKQFLIDSINKTTYSWGWGSGASKKDIVGAEESAVEITGSTVPWADIPMPQMMKIIDHYLTFSDLKLRELGQHNLAVAIFCQESGQADSVANYVTKALDSAPYLEEEVQRQTSGY
jgi:hypothetical protein